MLGALYTVMIYVSHGLILNCFIFHSNLRNISYLEEDLLKFRSESCLRGAVYCHEDVMNSRTAR